MRLPLSQPLENLWKMRKFARPGPGGRLSGLHCAGRVAHIPDIDASESIVPPRFQNAFRNPVFVSLFRAALSGAACAAMAPAMAQPPAPKAAPAANPAPAASPAAARNADTASQGIAAIVNDYVI